MVKRGFSLLELVIAIFLIAVVIGTVLLLLAANLNIINKANELMIANALVQYSIEEVKNIDFPPVYADRQDYFGDEITYDSIVDVSFYSDWTPKEFKEKFKIIRFVQGYDSSGSLIIDFNNTKYDEAMILKIIVYVIRRKDGKLILKTSTFVSRNGLY
ncbi:prepilin-type N-terminal cleavage/methylation domain-containing protein [bacterium]|nr:prepilin-type N-terminal cleavage/methylation domain-containing protein [bacterium]